MKKCRECKKEKLITEFNKLKTAKDGLQYMCRSCQKDYREANKEAHKLWLKENKEHIKKVHSKYLKKNSKKVKQDAINYMAKLDMSEGYGVYFLTHLPTQKYYIGEGKLHMRKTCHFNRLKRGVNNSKGLQEHFNQYPNIEEWEFKVIYKFDDYNKVEGLELEKFIIQESVEKYPSLILNKKRLI